MEWISSMFSWEIAGLAAMAVLGAAALILLRRIWRGGLGTFEESSRKMQRRISDTGVEIRERNLAMPVSEQLHIVEVALQELLELEGKPAGYAVQRLGKSLRLTTPSGDVDISYAVRQSTLRSARRVMRGAARWEVRNGEESQVFPELVQLMRHVRGMVALKKSLAVPGEDIPPLSHSSRASRGSVGRVAREEHTASAIARRSTRRDRRL